VFQPDPTTSHQGYYGLGDLNPSFFLSPKTGKVIWGIGSTFVLPTTSSTYIGQGKFSMGPTAVVLVQPAKWTLGFLTNNVWSVGGPRDRAPVNQFPLQYFINYNMQKGWLVYHPATDTDCELEGFRR